MQSNDKSVTIGAARFSALSDGLVRLEWSSDGTFEDRPTPRVLTRPAAVPFLVCESGEEQRWQLQTGTIQILYIADGQPFNDANLHIGWHVGERSGAWTPSTVDTENLGGTLSSLDLIHRYCYPKGVHPAKVGEHYPHLSQWLYIAMRKYHQELRSKGERTGFEDPPLWYMATHRRGDLSPELQEFFRQWERFPPGILSRSGYAVLDDSDGAPLDPGTGFPGRRNGGVQDWYFFAYGSDYSHALAEFVRLCGKIPMLPDWAFGPWFSLFDDLSEADYRELVAQFDAHGLPLSVVVLDVDWHRAGWCGWDWNTDLIPAPVEFLAWGHRGGLHFCANVHIDGVPPEDSQYVPLCEALEIDPEAVRRGEIFAVRNPTAEWTFESWQPDATGSYMPTEKALEDGWLLVNLAKPEDARQFMDILHRPREADGLDFWWIDGESAKLDGLNSQLWTNHVYYQHTLESTGKRPLILARTGGVGSHRYPVQFSADTYSHWEVLRFLVDFTARAGNVGVAYWSHDLGGFYGHSLGVPTIDPELFVRWVQYGCWSPLVRMHSDHGRREPWAYGLWVLKALQAALRTRSRLIPYLAHLGRIAHETGLPLCRPLYLQFPEDPEAYAHPDEYFLGEDVLVAPVVEPGGLRRVWLPGGGGWWSWEGDGYYEASHLELYVPLDRVPVFVRAGAILPLAEVSARPGLAPPDPLVLAVYAGDGGELCYYEDDGESLAYLMGGGSQQRFSQGREDHCPVLTCDPVQGTYAGMSEQRDLQVRWHGLPLASQIVAEGVEMAEPRWEGAVLVVALKTVSRQVGWKLTVLPGKA